MITNTKLREKRFITDIGKDSDDLIKKLKVLIGNKKLTKKEIIYRSLEYSFINKINFKESPEKPITRKDLAKIENNMVAKMEFYTKEVNEMLSMLRRSLKK